MNHWGGFGVSLRAAMLTALALAVSACATGSGIRVKEREFASLEASFVRHIDVLASEEFGGRRPGTIGETKTLDYLRTELESAGFESGTNDPSNPWNAPVLLASLAWSESNIEVRRGRRVVALPSDQSIAFTQRRRGLVERGEAVFVGYESDSVDPELVKGRVVIMLSEPGVSPERRAKLFGHGPSAIITVVEDASTISELREFQSRERLILASQGNSNLSSFITREAMQGALGERAWAEMVEAAEQARDGGTYEAQVIDGQFTIDARTTRRDVRSHNFLARLPGKNPQSGAILLLAHWDHFGTCGPEDADDRLCNGAVDNASGLALMVELGKRISAGKPLDRDIYVLGTTAEEWGLLGAQAFVEEPPVPLESIVAAFNFDTVAIGPRGSAVGFIGEGRTPLDSMIKQAVNDAGRELAPRDLVEQFLQRQDGWALLQRDVPAVLLSNAFGDEDRLLAFLRGDYHQASDEPGNLEVGGAVEDLLLHELLIRRIGDTRKYP